MHKIVLIWIVTTSLQCKRQEDERWLYDLLWNGPRQAKTIVSGRSTAKFINNDQWVTGSQLKHQTHKQQQQKKQTKQHYDLYFDQQKRFMSEGFIPPIRAIDMGDQQRSS